MVRKQMKLGGDGKYTLYNLGEFGEPRAPIDQEGEGIFDVFKNVGTKIAAKLTGKAAKEIATKAATKAFEKGAEKVGEKVGEKTGQLIGEKIYNKFSAPAPPKPQPGLTAVVQPPPKVDKGLQIVKELQKDTSWLPRERSTPRAPPKEKALIDVFDELFLK